MSGLRGRFVLVLLAAGLAGTGAATASPSGVSAVETASAAVAQSAQSKGAAFADTSVDEACTRKVKVVYAGYGEAERAACGSVTR